MTLPYFQDYGMGRDLGYATYAPATIHQLHSLRQFIESMAKWLDGLQIDQMAARLTVAENAITKLSEHLADTDEAWAAAVSAVNDTLDEVTEALAAIRIQPLVTDISIAGNGQGSTATIKTKSGIPGGAETVKAFASKLVSSNGTVGITTTQSAQGVTQDLSVQTDGNSLLTDLDIEPNAAGGFDLTNSAASNDILVELDNSSPDQFVAISSEYATGSTKNVIVSVSAGEKYVSDQAAQDEELADEITRAMSEENVLQANIDAETEARESGDAGIKAVTKADSLSITSDDETDIHFSVNRSNIGGTNVSALSQAITFGSEDNSTDIEISAVTGGVHVDLSSRPALSETTTPFVEAQGAVWSTDPAPEGEGLALVFRSQTIDELHPTTYEVPPLVIVSADDTVEIQHSTTGDGEGLVDLSIQGAVDTITADMDTLADRVTTAEGDIDSLDQRTGALEGRATSLETLTSSQGAAITTLQTDMDQAQGAISDLEDSVESIHVTDDAQNSRLTALEGEISSSHDAAQDDAIAALQAAQATQATALQAETTRATNAETALGGRIDTASSTLGTLTGQLGQIQLDLTAETSARAAADTAETTRATDAETALGGRIDSLAASRDQFALDLGTVGGSVYALTQRVDTAEADIAELQAAGPGTGSGGGAASSGPVSVVNFRGDVAWDTADLVIAQHTIKGDAFGISGDVIIQFMSAGTPGNVNCQVNYLGTTEINFAADLVKRYGGEFSGGPQYQPLSADNGSIFIFSTGFDPQATEYLDELIGTFSIDDPTTGVQSVFYLTASFALRTQADENYFSIYSELKGSPDNVQTAILPPAGGGTGGGGVWEPEEIAVILRPPGTAPDILLDSSVQFYPQANLAVGSFQIDMGAPLVAAGDTFASLDIRAEVAGSGIIGELNSSDASGGENQTLKIKAVANGDKLDLIAVNPMMTGQQLNIQRYLTGSIHTGCIRAV